MDNRYRQSQLVLNANLRRMVDQMNTPHPLLEILRQRPKPLTRWERVQRWFRIRGERVALAYRVLRGDDIHEDCY